MLSVWISMETLAENSNAKVTWGTKKHRNPGHCHLCRVFWYTASNMGVRLQVPATGALTAFPLTEEDENARSLQEAAESRQHTAAICSI